MVYYNLMFRYLDITDEKKKHGQTKWKHAFPELYLLIKSS